MDKSRVATIVFGKPLLRDRDEEEVAGYREALKLIHGQGAALPVSQETILKLHRLARGEIWDAGKYKEKDCDILERLIEQNKERYYETLEQSSQGWHEGRHDPWPFINYVLFILKTAYQEFEERVGQNREPKGAKAGLVLNAIRKQAGDFRLVDIEQACPGVGRDWIRALLADLKSAGNLTCRGKGPAARWRYHDSKGSISK